jgi:hypothetical protein
MDTRWERLALGRLPITSLRRPRRRRDPPVGFAFVRAMSPTLRSEITAACVAVATALVLGLAGCAAAPGPKPTSPASAAELYVGVFTGEFVDGRPLYRFPPILVIGSRIRVAPDL